MGQPARQTGDSHQDHTSRSKLLATMKQRGFTIVETIKAATQLFGLDLKEAKLLVTSDPSWVATARAAEPFQQELVATFREMADVDPSLSMPEQPAQPQKRRSP